MQHKLILFLLAVIPYVSRAQNPSYLHEMETRLENSRKYTLQVAQAMPEDRYGYKPADDEMDFRSQLLHMAQNISWLTSTHLTTLPNPITESMLKNTGQSKADVEKAITTAFDYALDAVRHFDAANLEQQVSFFAGPLSKRQIMQLINDHQAHHRGQLVVYLRLNGIKPPAYIGW